MRPLALLGSLFILVLAAHFTAQLTPARGKDHTLTLALRTRDAKTNELKTAPLTIDPHRTGIVIVDMWNYHWCMTWTDQAGGMSYRMNRALAGRKLGMQIFWGPTDTSSTFIDWPQRQRAMAVPYIEVPKVRSINCRWTVGTGPCLCGPGIACQVNYGNDAMDERLEIADSDLIVSGTQELYSLCKARGITRLIYFGGATNICLTGKDIGLGPMYSAGLDCYFARDLAFAWTHYDPVKHHTPSVGNDIAADDLERGGIPTIVFVDELRKAGLWDDRWITEPGRVTPAGKKARPYFFEKSVAVSLDVPFVNGAEIHYTLDGSEPIVSSAKYERPVVLDKTSTIHAVAFRKGEKVSLPNDGYFVHLPPRPPKPNVLIDGLTSVTDLYAKIGPTHEACLWQPRIGQSYEGKPLRIRGTKYDRGIGMRAPGYLRYVLKPEYDRFVALAGADDNMLDVQNGRNIAAYPSMVFKVFVDGKLAAESPVMRISQEPWRFDVPLPRGSRQIVLACAATGHRDPYQLGNWVRAGFVMKKGAVVQTAASSDPEMALLYSDIKARFEKLRPQSIRPAEGFIKHDYLIPAGYYKQMWDWDGFFIGCHLTSIGKPEYLKYWVLNFAAAVDKDGYVPGCITTEGPRPIFGKFAMKPFLAQGAFLSSRAANDFTWIIPVYARIKAVCEYRERTQLDKRYGLFFWDNAMQSGADNSVVLSNDDREASAILGVDINVFQYREYLALAKIAERFGEQEDAAGFHDKARRLKANILKYHWDKERFSFWNVRRRDGRAIRRVSYSNFVPLIQKDLLSPADGREMIRRYLWNREQMLADFGIRSLSKQDPDYNNENIINPYSNWQGPVWPVANYLCFIGLKNYGRDDECRQLAKTLGTMLVRDISQCGSMHENYHADTGQPLAPTAEQSQGGVFTGFVGWNLLVENMFMGIFENHWLLLEIE